MSDAPNFKVGDVVKFRPEHEDVRRNYRLPHEMVVESLTRGYEDWLVNSKVYEYRLVRVGGPW